MAIAVNYRYSQLLRLDHIYRDSVMALIEQYEELIEVFLCTLWHE